MYYTHWIYWQVILMIFCELYKIFKINYIFLYYDQPNQKRFRHFDLIVLLFYKFVIFF